MDDMQAIQNINDIETILITNFPSVLPTFYDFRAVYAVGLIEKHVFGNITYETIDIIVQLALLIVNEINELSKEEEVNMSQEQMDILNKITGFKQ